MYTSMKSITHPNRTRSTRFPIAPPSASGSPHFIAV
jgi:hypothetical protein